LVASKADNLDAILVVPWDENLDASKAGQRAHEMVDLKADLSVVQMADLKESLMADLTADQMGDLMADLKDILMDDQMADLKGCLMADLKDIQMADQMAVGTVEVTVA
jgi:hypothetical protein